MKRMVSVFLLLVAAAYTQSAAGQQAADNLNEQQRLGRQVVGQACGVCHLPPAKGARTYGPALSKGAGGGDENVVREYIVNGTPRMPSFKYFLQPSEIDAVVAYLKTVPVPANK